MAAKYVINSHGLGDVTAVAPLGIVATMPILPPGTCGPSQTYISPGSAFTSGRMAGIITPTGACQDPATVPGNGLDFGGFDALRAPNVGVVSSPSSTFGLSQGVWGNLVEVFALPATLLKSAGVTYSDGMGITSFVISGAVWAGLLLFLLTRGKR